MKVKQLTIKEVEDVGKTCEPYEIPGDIKIKKLLLLSMVNEILQTRRRFSGEKTFEIVSLVSLKDNNPYVQFKIGSEEFQLSTQEAFYHAMRILQVVNGADADAFLFNFVKDELGMEPEKANQILPAFREYRLKKYETEH